MTHSQSDSVKRIKVWTKAPRGKRGFLFELGELFLATPSRGTQFLFESPGVKYAELLPGMGKLKIVLNRPSLNDVL